MWRLYPPSKIISCVCLQLSQVVDALLDNIEFSLALRALCAWITLANSFHHGLLHDAQTNIASFLKAELHAQNGGTVLHAAAQEGKRWPFLSLRSSHRLRKSFARPDKPVPSGLRRNPS